MTALANPKLAALQRKVQAERRRRGDHGYNDAHVKRIAVHLVIEEIDLADLTSIESLAIAQQLALTRSEYVSAIEWIDPQHAAALQREFH